MLSTCQYCKVFLVVVAAQRSRPSVGSPRPTPSPNTISPVPSPGASHHHSPQAPSPNSSQLHHRMPVMASSLSASSPQPHQVMGDLPSPVPRHLGDARHPLPPSPLAQQISSDFDQRPLSKPPTPSIITNTNNNNNSTTSNNNISGGKKFGESDRRMTPPRKEKKTVRMDLPDLEDEEEKREIPKRDVTFSFPASDHGMDEERIGSNALAASNGGGHQVKIAFLWGGHEWVLGKSWRKNCRTDLENLDDDGEFQILVLPYH